MAYSKKGVKSASKTSEGIRIQNGSVSTGEDDQATKKHNW